MHDRQTAQAAFLVALRDRAPVGERGHRQLGDAAERTRVVERLGQRRARVAQKARTLLRLLEVAPAGDVRGHVDRGDHEPVDCAVTIVQRLVGQVEEALARRNLGGLDALAATVRLFQQAQLRSIEHRRDVGQRAAVDAPDPGQRLERSVHDLDPVGRSSGHADRCGRLHQKRRQTVERLGNPDLFRHDRVRPCRPSLAPRGRRPGPRPSTRCTGRAPARLHSDGNMTRRTANHMFSWPSGVWPCDPVVSFETRTTTSNPEPSRLFSATF